MKPEDIALLPDEMRVARTRPGQLYSCAWRRKRLRALKRCVQENRDGFCQALFKDLGKSPLESWMSELESVLHEIDYAIARLGFWMRPRRVRTPLFCKPGRSTVHADPMGVVLILGAWNYPVQLLLNPLVGALAAGNAAVVKPSEYAPATARLLADVLPRYFGRNDVRVVTGDADTARALVDAPFDFIFYTGSTSVGRHVMRAAARHLTPVVLELGGKCPCIVSDTADLKVASRRIAWGKYLNAGQTCVAPDYVLVYQACFDRMLEQLGASVEAFFGDDPFESRDYARIVNDRHYQRLAGLLTDGNVEIGGDTVAKARYISPTVMRDIEPDSALLRDEIFGPLLPVIPVQDLNEALSFVHNLPAPLSLYLFSSDRSEQRRVRQCTRSGGICINDVILHLANPRLPFGGVGGSGMGRYHGKAGFDAFSYRRSELVRSTRWDTRSRYPPYSDAVRKWLPRLTRFFR